MGTVYLKDKPEAEDFSYAYVEAADGSLVRVKKEKIVAMGKDGGYFTPTVDDDGNLAWTPSKEGMPEVEGTNIKGPKGDPGYTPEKGTDYYTEADKEELTERVLEKLPAVKYEAQELTEEQKTIARENVGAASEADKITVSYDAENKIVRFLRGGVTLLELPAESQEDGSYKLLVDETLDMAGMPADAAAVETKFNSLSLGIASDGLIYLFIEGKPVGTGIQQGQSGDVLGYVDENNTIILTGNLADGTYSIKYEMEDGTLVDVGDFELVDENAPTYTNLADPTSDDWQEGYRLSIGSGGTSELAGHTTTNYIPCTANDVVRIKGFIIHNDSLSGGESASPKFVIYNANKSKIGGIYGTSATGSDQAYGLKVVVDGDISTYIVAEKNDGGNNADSTCSYIRFDGFLIDGYTSKDVIITVNEEIV